MPTTVTLTGTGVPHPRPGRAGAGTLVRHGDTLLQFDAGRGTTLRLADAGVSTHELSALLLTHVHSDHVVDVADLVLTRWVLEQLHPATPLPVVAPEGSTARFVDRVLEAYDDDIAVRLAHVGGGGPRLEPVVFPVRPEPAEVWRSPDSTVTVEAVGVHHEPVEGAVAYRVGTPDAVVVISGDTRVCPEVEALAQGADIVVHEASRRSAFSTLIRGTALESIFDYHADTVELGAMAERARVGHLVLTHLIPPPDDAASAEAFADDLRRGGYTGRVSVGEDLDHFTVGD